MASHQDWVRFGTVARLSRGSVLDWGCGTGEMASAVAVFGHKIFGIGLNDRDIQLARKRTKEFGLDCRFTLWDKNSIPLPDACFGTVVLHAGNEAADSYDEKLREAIRLCAPGGRLIFDLSSSGKKRIPSALEAVKKELGVKFVKWMRDRGARGQVGYGEKPGVGNTPVNIRIVEDFFLDPLPFEPLDTSRKVSVIVATYNRAQLLIDCLESLLNQTYPNVEIVVVNDGSTDETDEIIKPYLPSIKYIRKENGGKSSALNAGLKQITGEYVWVFDDDDIALPRKLELDIRFFQGNPDIDIVHSYGYRFCDSTGEIFSTYMSTIKDPDETLLRILEWPQILNISMVAKRECYERVGPFREDLIRSEDYEIWFRLARNYRIKLLESATVLVRKQRGSARSKKGRAFTLEQEIRYEQMVFAEIYRDFRLSDYYPALGHGPVDPCLRAFALMERARIMSMHYLNDLARRDLQSIFEMVQRHDFVIDTPFIERMVSIWQQAIINNNHEFSRGILDCLRNISTHSRENDGISTYLSKRYFWSFYNSLKSMKFKISAQRLMISFSFFFIMFRKRFT